MLKKLLACTCLTLSLGANAAILNFDDLTVTGSSYPGADSVSNPYEGYNFSAGLFVVKPADSFVPGPLANAQSGDNGLGNVEGGSGVITAAGGGDFYFGGLSAVAFRLGTSLPGGTIQGYNDGDLVWTINTSLDGTANYADYGPEVAAIDVLKLDLGNYFLVDDIELTAVPLPAAAWFFGSALLGLAGIKRKRA